MADPRGFIKVPHRELPADRAVSVRIMDYKEVHDALDINQVVLNRQASRCMDCGVPFCMSGCPLGNLIPDWNDLVWKEQWERAADTLHATNNFPEFTGRVCPATCETACVLGISREPVTIKSIEVSIIERAFADSHVCPQIPERLSGYTVAVVGSGPSGLAAAQQLTRAGHTVAVYERDHKIGGLLRYGIPNFKLEKAFIDRRIEQMEIEGTRFRPGVEIGRDISWAELRERYDAIVVAIGSTIPRDLPIEGRDCAGIHFAMDFLHQANDRVAGEEVLAPIDAQGKTVVVVGGGDTGSDCVGTALRQGAAEVISLEITPRPPESRPVGQPWPTYPMVYRISSSHAEGGSRKYSTASVKAVANSEGQLDSLVIAEAENFKPVSGTEQVINADLMLLAMGFVGPEVQNLSEQLGTEIAGRGTIKRNSRFESSISGVFVAGDAGRGQSLVVWAIAEGRSVAAAVDEYLVGQTQLPCPIAADTVPMRL